MDIFRIVVAANAMLTDQDDDELLVQDPPTGFGGIQFRRDPGVLAGKGEQRALQFAVGQRR